MTDLLDPPSTQPGRRTEDDDPPLRPLTLSAAAAGLVASGAVLLACMAVGLAGWFASDAGGHGTTRDALRVGTDGWLLAQGAHLHLLGGSAPTSITAVPLGLTLLCAYVAHRLGLWAATTSAVESRLGLGLAALVLSSVYAVVALVSAVLAASTSAEPSLVGALVGGFLVALVGGGSGLLRGAGDEVDWRAVVPEPVRAVLAGALASALLVVVAGSVLAAAALLMHLDTAANVLARLHADTSGGLLYTLVVAAVAPNLGLMGSAYLLGPGFAVGAGTAVSPASVVLGPLPAFPPLAALPAPGTPPAWVGVLVAAPFLAGLLGAVLMHRRHPVLAYEGGALRGLLAGLAGGLVLTALVMLAGGSVGPGRMSDVGADLLPVLVSACAALGLGGLVGSLAATWAARHR